MGGCQQPLLFLYTHTRTHAGVDKPCTPLSLGSMYITEVSIYIHVCVMVQHSLCHLIKHSPFQILLANSVPLSPVESRRKGVVVG